MVSLRAVLKPLGQFVSFARFFGHKLAQAGARRRIDVKVLSNVQSLCACLLNHADDFIGLAPIDAATGKFDVRNFAANFGFTRHAK